ncbi:insulinase family protein [Nibribacter ruber]|uniref:Insulinase family protein n=1 Tax=Nibribacter ruber TaxID=2698458 RepID=A0A6P1P3E7_9BACT|nr:insulinase family protein [Nibribacter ruber]QHL88922.1 insulinase family protein [Nibribacter ruber]
MKKYILIAASALLLFSAEAQVKVDRSKKPAAGPAPVITLKDPVTFKLKNGITVLVVEDHKLPKVSASYFIDAGPITEGAKAGVVGLMGQMLNEGTKDMTKAQFDEAVDKMGADVGLSASGGSASALTRYFNEAFALMGKGLKNPAFTQESFDKLKSQTLTGMKSDEKNVKAISGRVVNALTYGKTHPSGEFATEESIKNLTLADVKAAYAKYITPSRGYLTIIGDIKPDAAKKLAESVLGDLKGPALTLPKLAAVPNPAKTEINVVDMSNAVQSEITVTNLVDLKMNNPDYFPVLLANQILGGGSESRLFNNLREKHGFTYGAYSSIGSGRFQTDFSASASVRTAKTDSAVVEFINEINKLRNEKVSDEELASAKALYNGSFALGLENKGLTASFARNILINDLPKDFYRTYLQRVNAVTKEDIQRVAQKYFNSTNTRVVVVGNASQMLDNLKKLSYPVKQYDTFANAIAAGASAAATANVKAVDVFNNYIKASGGEAELRKVKTILANMTMNMQGASLAVEAKYMAPNLEAMTMTMGGQPVVKTRFNGTTGYQEQMGQKKEMTAEEIKEKAAITGLFEQLDYVKNPAFKAEVKGMEKVNGSDAYKVQVTYPTGKTKTEFYDVASKLLVKSEEATTANNMTVNNSTEYGDYKKVGNILYPHSITLTVSAAGQQQVLDMKAQSVKLNEGVTAADFN